MELQNHTVNDIKILAKPVTLPNRLKRFKEGIGSAK